jgi:hypothetical protein
MAVLIKMTPVTLHVACSFAEKVLTHMFWLK